MAGKYGDWSRARLVEAVSEQTGILQAKLRNVPESKLRSELVRFDREREETDRFLRALNAEMGDEIAHDVRVWRDQDRIILKDAEGETLVNVDAIEIEEHGSPYAAILHHLRRLVCGSCGVKLLPGEQGVCGPCEAQEIMALLRLREELT